jgi:hypothetical protein
LAGEGVSWLTESRGDGDLSDRCTGVRVVVVGWESGRMLVLVEGRDAAPRTRRPCRGRGRGREREIEVLH